jgi:hypothetical protein
MSSPFSSTSPASCAEGTFSCIRFKIRKNVDFPHPDGPINAVTVCAGIVNDTRSSTLFDPNHADTFAATRLAGDLGRSGGPLSSESNVVVAVTLSPRQLDVQGRTPRASTVT